MPINYIVEPVAGNGFVARTDTLLALQAEGATSEEAENKLRELVAQRLTSGIRIQTVEVPSDNPWTKFAGMFKDDPYFAEWQRTIAENRKKADSDDDAL